MPAALKVDWGAARALYVGGLDAEDVAKQLDIEASAVRQRVHRGKWNQERENLKNLVKTNPAKKEDSVSQSVINALHGTFTSWKESAIHDVAQAGAAIAANLRKMATDPSATYDTQSIAFQQFEPASRVLKPFLGLNDAQQVNVGVQVNMLTEVPEMEVFELPK